MFYGGWSSFTDMDKFVSKSGVDTIYNHWPGSLKMPGMDNKFTWGYGDDVIFDKSFDNLNKVKSPYFSLYLTLSTHYPFIINNQEKYMERVKEMLNDINNDATHNYVSKHIKEISTFIMFDKQLQLFFEKYKTRADFQKTIFVITGDHKSVLFPVRNNIDKYYVPIIIYSPLLKQNKEFGAVVSHYDITPAISKLLSVKYQLQMPAYSQYLGNDLDTNTNFVSNQRLFFMRNSRVVDEYLYKDIFIAGDRLFKVDDLMQLTPISDDSLRDKMKKEINDYMKLQIYSIHNNILIK